MTELGRVSEVRAHYPTVYFMDLLLGLPCRKLGPEGRNKKFIDCV